LDMGNFHYGAPDPIIGTKFEKERQKNADKDLFTIFEETFKEHACNISQIHIVKGNFFSASAFVSFVNHVRPPLLHLTLNSCFVHCRNYTTIFESLSQHAKSLTSFETDAYLNAPELGKIIAESFPNLEDLRIPFLITDHEPLLNLTNLTVLHISHFRAQDEKVIKKIEKHLAIGENKKQCEYSDTKGFFQRQNDTIELYWLDDEDAEEETEDTVTLLVLSNEFNDVYSGEGLHWGDIDWPSECHLEWKVGASKEETLTLLQDAYIRKGRECRNGFCGIDEPSVEEREEGSEEHSEDKREKDEEQRDEENEEQRDEKNEEEKNEEQRDEENEEQRDEEQSD